jgi:hypothetical protein
VAAKGSASPRSGRLRRQEGFGFALQWPPAAAGGLGFASQWPPAAAGGLGFASQRLAFGSQWGANISC